eukprot:jgi/Picsp_1/3242/NSC_06082-R1_rotamase fkbp 1
MAPEEAEQSERIDSSQGQENAVDVTDDGGVVKEVLRHGLQSERLPQLGDTVEVHYVGSLEVDGREFDSSRKRNQPFKFELGKGKVIKGWDLGVATMSKGEIAKLTIAPEYGYGPSGAGDSIPPNSTLVFEVEMLGWKSQADVLGDGGIMKYVEHEGDGWATPNAQDEVVLSLEARALGATEPFLIDSKTVFSIEDGHLCDGLGEVVKTMKKGEEARVELSPDYAFGDSEKHGLQPNSPIELRLKLLGWHKVEWVTKDKSVIKKTLNSPEDWKHPNAGAVVTVSYTGMLSDGTIFDHRGEDNPLIFVTEEDQSPCEGLESAIMKMKLGEHALVTIKPEYGFGSQTTRQSQAIVPGESTLTYDVILRAFNNAKESWDMETVEKLEAAHSLKEKGNQAFKAGRLARALTFWERAKSFVEFHDSFDSESKLKAKSMLRSIDLNMSAAHLKNDNIGMAQTLASKVLENDPYNMKALYRRAQTYIRNGDWVEASQDIKTALGSEPKNKDFVLLAKQLKLAESRSSKNEAKIWASTFAKLQKNAVA